MTHEEICTYEVCKLAKKKGFNEYVEAFYAEDCSTLHSQGPEKWNEYKDRYAASTQSLLQRWLREEKKYAISVFWDMLSKAYYYEIVKTFGVLEIPIEEKSNHFSPKGFDIYEFALEDALKYTLENLVKTCGKH